jgi:acyl carrier protein
LPVNQSIWSYGEPRCNRFFPSGFSGDAHLNPVPVGAPGELHIGGDGLSRGYLNRADLTAEKFIPNPFRNEPGARLYRTGDLARHLADGNIEFLGRIDHQVKIRGYRIELGEIEAILGQHPLIKQTVVVAREDAPGNKRLVAYLVATGGETLSAMDLRNMLKQKLPEFMIPSSFVFVDSLTLTPNGKVDRKALPTPDTTRPELDEAFVAPRTPMERLVAEIWAEVLKLNQVGVFDNFFDLGGHSLIATQVVSRLRQMVGIELPLRTLFEHPTVGGLAGYLVMSGLASRQDQPTGDDAAGEAPTGLAARNESAGAITTSSQQRDI